MDFDFTEGEKMFQRTMRDYCVRELRPLYVEETRESIKQGKALSYRLPPGLVKKTGTTTGCYGVGQPGKYGGTPADDVGVMQGITSEEMGREYFALSISTATQKCVLDSLLVVAGGDAVRDELAPLLISGEKIGGIFVTEPEAGSDAARIKMTATRDGDYYILNGEKTSATFGMFSDCPLVVTTTNPAAGARGATAIIVPLDLPGIIKSDIYHIGGQGMGGASIICDNVRVPVKYRCGEEGQGFILAMRILDWQRNCLALNSLGPAEVSLEETVEYVKGRNAFGQPVGKFEGVSFKLAEDSILVAAARLLCYKALWLYDQKREKELSLATAQAKSFTPRIATQVIHDCILLHGHVGFSSEYLLGRRLMDAMCWEIGDGTLQIMDTIIVREMMGSNMVAYKR